MERHKGIGFGKNQCFVRRDRLEQRTRVDEPQLLSRRDVVRGKTVVFDRKECARPGIGGRHDQVAVECERPDKADRDERDRFRRFRRREYRCQGNCTTTYCGAARHDNL